MTTNPYVSIVDNSPAYANLTILAAPDSTYANISWCPNNYRTPSQSELDAAIVGYDAGQTLTSNPLTYTGNISAGYFNGNHSGNGAALTGITSSYGNANVAVYLPTYTGNLNAGLFTGNFSGNGARITNVPGATNYANANVNAYLSTYTGNISATNFVGNGALLTGVLTPTTQTHIMIGNRNNDVNISNCYVPGTSSGHQADRPITLVDDYATMKIVRPAGFGNPMLEFQEWDSTLSTMTGYWDVGSIDGTMQFRSREFPGDTAYTFIKIDQVGNVTVGNLIASDVSSITGEFTGNVTAPYFVGNVVGTSSNTTNVSLLTVPNNSTAYPLVIAASQSPGVMPLYTSNEVTYNPVTNALVLPANSSVSATSFSGNLVGNATAASNVYVSSTSVNAAVPLILGSSVAGGSQSLAFDTNVTFNPSTNALTITGGSIAVPTISGNITGTSATFTTLGATTGTFTSIGGSITTASQTNITAVGNLTSLSSSGNITTSAYFVGNGSQLTGVNTLYGNTQVGSYLPTYTGNIGGNAAGVLTSVTTANADYPVMLSSVSSAGNQQPLLETSLTFNPASNVLISSGNVVTSNGYFIGNGSQLTGLNTVSQPVTSYFSGYTTSGATLTTTPTPIPINTEIRKDPIYTHTAGVGNVKVANAGWYKVEAQASFTTSSSNAKGFIQIYLNGAAVTGAQTSLGQSTNAYTAHGAISFHLNCSANANVALYAWSTLGSFVTVANSSRLLIESM